jgi:Tfp pilus assembly major pilin PilA
MKAHRNSRGITLIGFLIMLCVAGFFAYIVMKLVPVYVEYFGVVKAMEQIKNEPGAAQKSVEEIRRDLNVKFDLQYVDEHDLPPPGIEVKR